MDVFQIERNGELSSPRSAEDLRRLGGARPEDRLRLGDQGPFRPLGDLLHLDPQAVGALEDALDPDEPPVAPWQRRPLAHFSWVALLLSADALWVVLAAARHQSLAGWANAGLLVCTLAVAAVGLLARRAWAWPLSALATAAMTAWMAAPLVATGETGFAVWTLANLLAATFLIARRPHGPALDWPPRLRRLLLAYSTDPAVEARAWSRPAPGRGPWAALAGAVLFFLIVLVGIALYHRLMFPELELAPSLVPRGGGTAARLASTTVYFVMVVLAWLLAGRGRTAAAALGLARPRGLTRSLVTGARIFLVLFIVLLGGRWVLRTAEAVEQRLSTTTGAAEGGGSGAVNVVRDAVREVVDRPRGAGAFAPWALFVAILLGPICEEIFFRGLVFGALRRRWPFWAAASTSAALFAVAHVLGSGWGDAAPLLLFEVAAGGLAAAYAYEVSGSLASPVALHVLWNFTQTVMGAGATG